MIGLLILLWICGFDEVRTAEELCDADLRSIESDALHHLDDVEDVVGSLLAWALPNTSAKSQLFLVVPAPIGLPAMIRVRASDVTA